MRLVFLRLVELLTLVLGILWESEVDGLSVLRTLPSRELLTVLVPLLGIVTGDFAPVRPTALLWLIELAEPPGFATVTRLWGPAGAVCLAAELVLVGLLLVESPIEGLREMAVMLDLDWSTRLDVIPVGRLPRMTLGERLTLGLVVCVGLVRLESLDTADEREDRAGVVTLLGALLVVADRRTVGVADRLTADRLVLLLLLILLLLAVLAAAVASANGISHNASATAAMAIWKLILYFSLNIRGLLSPTF
jgi:hypothetical protein